MEWTKLEYSKRQVDVTARVMVDPNSTTDDIEAARKVVNNWRVAHAFPLHTFQANLRRVIPEVDKNGTVAQRMKRLPAIALKLNLQHDMQLTRMQDIAGCRAILGRISQVDALVNAYRHSRFKHELIRQYDYIRDPKESGYRGVHLVYKYRSDKRGDYNDFRVEMQVRTRLQHAWATAVETVDLFEGRQLKNGVIEDVIEREWLRFFELMGSVIALKEGLPTVPNTPANRKELTDELQRVENTIMAVDRLTAFRRASREMLSYRRPKALKKVKYFLLELERDGEARKLKINRYLGREIDEAARAYFEDEQITMPTSLIEHKRDAVLVAVDSSKAFKAAKTLRAAYPNYFADTQSFVKQVKEALGQP